MFKSCLTGLKQTEISRGANLPNGEAEGLFRALQFGHVSDQRGALVKQVDEFRRFLGVDREDERAAFKLGDVFLDPFKLDFKIGVVTGRS